MPLQPTTLSWLAIAAAVIAVVGLLVALAAWRRAGRLPSRLQARPSRRTAPKPPRRTRPTEPLSSDQITAELDALRYGASTALRHLAVVRYDAFADMGGHLSWSLAILDDGGDGVVVTSIHGRSDARTYAKNISGWSASQQLSPEEIEAIGYARDANR